MTEIRPFSAVIYNQAKVKDLSRVVCPPYDVISPERQEQLFKKDPHNFIHILLNRAGASTDKYRKAAADFNDWLKKDILIKDKEPAVYYYSQHYKLRGENRVRSGFIALLRLREGTSSAFGHEHTHTEAKEDRMRLMSEVKANLSPIFVVFDDHKRIIQRMGRNVGSQEPFIELRDEDGTLHQLWRITDPKHLAIMQEAMKEEHIFIADGHHRYEVACLYRDQMKKKAGSLTGEESCNYMLTYFTATHSRGQKIFPIHRLFKAHADFSIDAFRQKLNEYFYVEEIKDKRRFLFLMEKGGLTEHLIGIYRQKRFLLLRLRNLKLVEGLISEKPKEYRALDVAILNYVVFKNALGVDPDDKKLVRYVHDEEELFKEVDNDPDLMAFFLNPVKIDQIISVALTGEKMPPKSTYFYPKVLSGMVIHKFE